MKIFSGGDLVDDAEPIWLGELGYSCFKPPEDELIFDVPVYYWDSGDIPNDPYAPTD